MHTFGKGLRLAAAGAMAASLVAFGGVQTAQAADGDCQHWKYHDQSNIGFDYYGAAAKCKSIKATKKARAKLDVNWDYDSHSKWFTALNRTYEVGGRSCGFGCKSDVDFGNR